MASTITFSEFAKVDLRVGRVLKAAPLENSEKLVRLTVDFGPPPSASRRSGGERNILAGFQPFFEPKDLEGTSFVFVLNLEPKKMAGEESYGMILCVDSPSGPKPLVAPKGSRPGEKIK